MFKPALLLAGYLLTGCTHSGDNGVYPDNRAETGPSLVQVIITFHQPPAADVQQLTTAIAVACRCAPVFIRQFDRYALIYEVELPPNQLFASFAEHLLSSGITPRVLAVDEDVRMKHQYQH